MHFSLSSLKSTHRWTTQQRHIFVHSLTAAVRGLLFMLRHALIEGAFPVGVPPRV
jgi:hypothetical protein